MGNVLNFPKRQGSDVKGKVPYPDEPLSPIGKALDDYFLKPSLTPEFREMLEGIIDREYTNEKS